MSEGQTALWLFRLPQGVLNGQEDLTLELNPFLPSARFFSLTQKWLEHAPHLPLIAAAGANYSVS